MKFENMTATYVLELHRISHDCDSVAKYTFLINFTIPTHNEIFKFTTQANEAISDCVA
jgi:hypothetical protein